MEYVQAMVNRRSTNLTEDHNSILHTQRNELFRHVLDVTEETVSVLAFRLAMRLKKYKKSMS